MRPELGSLLRRVGLGAVAIACAAALLAVVAFVLDVTAPPAGAAQPTIAIGGPAPSATPTVALTVTPRPGGAVASPALTTAPIASSPSAVAAPDARAAIAAERYTNGARVYAGLRAPIGAVIAAPFAGTVSVDTYQLISGEVRVGSNIPDQPFYPYVTVRGERGEVRFRPGALTTDVTLAVEDGVSVSAGAPLFTVKGEGPSSWRAFYDGSLTYQVVVSFTTARGVDLDPLSLFEAR